MSGEASGVEVPFTVEEHEGKRVGRGRSTDPIASLEKKLSKIRTSVGEILEWKETIDQTVETIVDSNKLTEAIDELKETTEGIREDLTEMITVVRDESRAKMSALEAQIKQCIVQDELKEKISLLEAQMKVCMTAVAGGAIGKATPRTEAPKPTKYEGKRDPKVLDEFLWSLECYFNVVEVKDDKSKIDTAVLYLSENAALWWRRKHADIEKGVSTIDSWDEFKKQLKRQFCPHNAEDVAMKKLRGLKHSGAIKDYVAEFTSLMLELPDLQEKEKLFFFQDGLQSWAYNELKRRNVLTIDEAIAAAEDLIDFRRDTPTRRPSGGDRFIPGPAAREGRPPARQPNFKGKMVDQGTRREIKCFFCDGPHLLRDCPKKKALNSMIIEEEKEPLEEGCLNSMRVLNSVEVKETKTDEATKKTGRGLMFVNTKLQNEYVKTLIDTGASHNFISEEEAKDRNIQYTKEIGWLKAVNSPSKPILGVAHNVPLEIGGWRGTTDLTIVPMDD
ncbi:hypothetical protein LXL04_036885 [Taraxacum kok-saghyz]